MPYLSRVPAHVAESAPFDRSAIEAAAARLSGRVHMTPALQNQWLNDQLSADIFFKCEHFQKGGAFKIRGAMNAVWQLSTDEAARGVVTHSSGNHAQALAIAAQSRQIPCTVVMPENSPQVKVQATRERGATVVMCRPTQADRVATTERLMAETGATLIHPFDQPNIVLGQATVAWELLHQVPDLDVILAPVGGGGLLAGTCLAAYTYSKSKPERSPVTVWATEPTGADDAYQSLLHDQRVTEQSPHTIADGLLTTLGQLTWPIISNHLDGIVTVTDAEINAAMQIYWERLKWVVEPSGAVSLAGLRALLQCTKAPSHGNSDEGAAHPPALTPGQTDRRLRIGVIISGGNRDFAGASLP